MNHRRRVLVAASLVAGLTGASPGAVAAEALVDCRIAGISNSLWCGTVRRPLDPARPDGVTIDIHYAVAPALARQKLADPVFLLAGGPGQSAISLAPAVLPLLARLNNRRDLVFVDQRGTGRSAPLRCDDPADDPRRAPLAEQADVERRFQRLMACKARLQGLPHGDLRFYTTPLATQDLDAVRRQLGAERINLVGASYGTRAALDYLRQFPQALRRGVLDGVAPPDMALLASASTDAQAALDALFAACRDEPACTAAHPDLRTDWQALLRRLPTQVQVANPTSGQPERFTLTRETLLGAVRGPLYAPALAAALPAAIDAAARGRYEPLFGLASLLESPRRTEPAAGMHYSVVCAEDLRRRAAPVDASGGGTRSSTGAAEVGAGASTDGGTTGGTRGAADRPGAEFGRDESRFYERVCADWPRGELPAAFDTVPPSASPVLLLSGGLDPATPPRHAARVAAALGEKALHVVVANAGHGLLGVGCAADVVFRFIDAADDDAAARVDAGCLKSIPRPPAFRPVRTPASLP